MIVSRCGSMSSILSHGWVSHSFELTHLWGLPGWSSQSLLEDVKIVDWYFRAVIVLRWYLWVPMDHWTSERSTNFQGPCMSLSLSTMNTGGLSKPPAPHRCTRISQKWIWRGGLKGGFWKWRYREDGVVGEMKGIPDGSDSSVRRGRNTEWGTSHGQILSDYFHQLRCTNQPPPNKVSLTCTLLHQNICRCDKSKVFFAAEFKTRMSS